MVEVTLKKNAKWVYRGEDGEVIELHRDKPMYFHEDHPFVKRLKSMKEATRAQHFEVNENIKAYKINEGWENLPPKALKDILEVLGKDTEGLKAQKDFVEAINEAIKEKLVVVEKQESAGSGNQNLNYKKLAEENKSLRKSLDELKEEMEKQRQAFEQALAEVLKKQEEGSKNKK